MHTPGLSRLASFGLAGLLATACGSDEATKKATPPPVVPGGDKADAFSLQGGTYYVEQVRDLQDGCGKRPLDSGDPITQVPFVLSNDGKGAVAIDFCSFNERSVSGTVRGNAGTLYALHQNRVVGTGAYAAAFDQECIIDVAVKADDSFSGHYTENQRNRNKAMRDATVDVPECATSFNFTMKRRS